MPKCSAERRIFGWPASLAAAGMRHTAISSRETATNMGNLRSGDGPGQPGRLGPGGHDARADAVAANGRGEQEPAYCGGGVLTAGHRPADQFRLADQRSGMGMAFGVVSVEQVGGGAAGQDVGDLPGEVVGVAQPGGQALADERWRQVGRVAEQEGSPDLEAGSESGPEGVDRAAGDLQPGEVGPAGPGLEQPAEGGDEVRLVLTVAQLELPPVPVGGDVHEGGGAGRIADLLDA